MPRKGVNNHTSNHQPLLDFNMPFIYWGFNGFNPINGIEKVTSSTLVISTIKKTHQSQ